MNLWAVEGEYWHGPAQGEVPPASEAPAPSVSLCTQVCGSARRVARAEEQVGVGTGDREGSQPGQQMLILHIPGPATLLSSVPQPRNTSWSDRSIMSICSSMSTFTSMEEMLPKGAAETEASEKVSTGAGKGHWQPCAGSTQRREPALPWRTEFY